MTFCGAEIAAGCGDVVIGIILFLLSMVVVSAIALLCSEPTDAVYFAKYI